MFNIKKFSILALIASNVMTQAHSAPISKHKLNNQIELLFFQEADKGKISISNSGCYDLVLSELNPDILYFSNFPSKKAGNLTITQFVETMTHNQTVEKIKPNAVVNMYMLEGSKRQRVNMIGSLSNASYQHNQFHYTFCPFIQNSKIKEGELRSINIFVDPIHRWPP